MDFSAALKAVKEGATISRKAWPIVIKVRAQFPDENSANTKPYLYMIKGDDRFPLDLSCESIFAEDWFIV